MVRAWYAPWRLSVKKWCAMQSRVRCADCGLLALRNNEMHRLVEADFRYREEGIPRRNQQGVVIYDIVPVCFVREVNFHEEIGDRPKDKAAPLVLRKERECKSFMPWCQGYSPKEHIEMNILQEQRDWQLRREEEDRRWRASQAEQEQEWRREQSGLSEKSIQQANKHHKWDLLIIGVLVALVTASTQLVAAFIERGTLFPDSSEMPSAENAVSPDDGLPAVFP